MAGPGTMERITGAMDYSNDYIAVTNDYKRLLIEYQKLQSLNESQLELQQKDDLKLSQEFKLLIVKYLFQVSPLKFAASIGKKTSISRSENYVTTILRLGNKTETEIDQLLQLKSTLHFKGSWVHPFNPISTKPSPFYNLTRRPFLVEMMFQRMEVPFADIESLDCTAVALPYRLNYTSGEDEESRLELMIFLPNSVTGLDNLEAKLVQQPFSVTLREFRESKDLFIYLPKFQLSSELDLRPALTQVGLESLFLSESASFSRMFQQSQRQGTGQFGVLKTSHFGRFSVDEWGTNGKAWSTAFVTKKESPIRKHLNPEVFRVDRPFVGVLYDSTRHMVLAMFRKTRFQNMDPLKNIAVPDALAAAY